MASRLKRSFGRSPKPTVVKTDEEWRAQLDDKQYGVLRRSMTERAFVGEYTDCHDEGFYCCAGCGAELFTSRNKFDSNTGWPSFTKPVDEDAVTFHKDFSHASVRTEVRCRACGGHLGHVFFEFTTPTHDRFCINSCALELDRRAVPEPEPEPLT